MNRGSDHKEQFYGLDTINVHFLDKASKLPLVISPRFDDSIEFICTWLKENRSWVNNQMQHYGAVLIRGFQIDSPVDFEMTTLALDPNLSDKYRGTSPRSLQKDTKYAFSAADVPVNYPIAQHLEMSFLRAPPKQLYFGCIKESRSYGGETSLCDFRKVYQDLSPELIDKFLSKKVKYSRMNQRVGDKYTFDVGAMKTWCDLFGTSNKKEVELICEDENAPKPQWIGPNNDTFYQEWIDEAIQRHPNTNDLVWFNHSQVFHWTTFPEELWYAFCRMKSLQLFIHFLLVSIFTFVKYGLLGYEMSLDITFGDGTPISCQQMREIRKAIHKNMVFSRWQKGDILCIDNFSTSHGRQPTYDKERKVVVAWSQPEVKPSLVDENYVVDGDVTCGAVLNNNEKESIIPSLTAVTPSSTPESSLTKQSAEELQYSLNVFKLTTNDDNNKVQHKTNDNNMMYHRRLRSCPNPLLTADSEFWNSTM